MLTPTRIYVKSCLAAIRETKAVKALAHITGGGFPDNIPRVLPKDLGARIDLARDPGAAGVPSGWPQTGGIAEKEMLRTFNCGIGMIAVVEPREPPTRSPPCSSARAKASCRSARSLPRPKASRA